MKNIAVALKRYWILVVVIFVVLLVFIGTTRSKSAEDYFLSNYDSATEILCHDSFLQDYEVIFFLEDNGYVSCALLKKELMGYKIIRTSGRLSISNPGYLCSFFGEDNSLWIDWGIVTDSSVKSVLADSHEMKMVECGPYSYKICWLAGNGTEPKNHVEKN